MLIPRKDAPPLDVSGLTAGRPDPRWTQANDAIKALIAAGEIAALDDLWRELADAPQLTTLTIQAWRGRAHCGVEGARLFLAGTAEAPDVETGWSTPEVWGSLLGDAQPQLTLAALLDAAKGETPAYVLAVAIQERVLRDGAIDEPALRRWRGPLDLPLETHPWERELLVETPFVHDTLGNFFARSRDEPMWPEGIEGAEQPAGTLAVGRQWGLDEEWDPAWPDGEPPPVGPFADPRLYPNGHSWCLEGLVEPPEAAFALGSWPFPPEHLDLSAVVAEPVSARRLLRQWIWRGVMGGAYAKNRCAAVARGHAWRALAALADIDEAPTSVEALARIARAAEGLRLGGFRSRGPSVDMLGGDFGFVALRPDGVAFAAAHTDSD